MTLYSKEVKEMARMNKNADLAPSKKEKMSTGQIILLLCLIVFTIFCFAPVLLVFISAFTDEIYITQHGFSFFPEKWSMSGMNAVLRYGEQLRTSYGITIFITLFHPKNFFLIDIPHISPKKKKSKKK